MQPPSVVFFSRVLTSTNRTAATVICILQNAITCAIACWRHASTHTQTQMHKRTPCVPREHTIKHGDRSVVCVRWVLEGGLRIRSVARSYVHPNTHTQAHARARAIGENRVAIWPNVECNLLRITDVAGFAASASRSCRMYTITTALVNGRDSFGLSTCLCVCVVFLKTLPLSHMHTNTNRDCERAPERDRVGQRTYARWEIAHGRTWRAKGRARVSSVCVCVLLLLLCELRTPIELRPPADSRWPYCCRSRDVREK